MARRNILTTKTVVTMLLTVLAGSGFWVMLVRPEIGRLRTAAATATALKLELMEIEKKKDLLDQVAARYDEIQTDLTKLNVAIPEASQTGQYLAALETLSAETGVTLTTVSTSYQEKKAAARNAESSNPADRAQTTTINRTQKLTDQLNSQFFATSFKMRLDGSYEAVKSFLTRLLALDRFATLDEVSLTATATDGTTLSANFTATIFHRQPAKAAANAAASVDTAAADSSNSVNSSNPVNQ